MSGISVDLTPIWQGISTNLPAFLGIFGPIIGISAAMALAAWIGAKIIGAFRGGSKM